jgi:DNA-binding HxlR family transcriptional regulator
VIEDNMNRVERAEDGLSDKQRAVLLWALKNVEGFEARKDDAALQWLEDGIPWRTALKSESARAATSRTLSRLEDRRLIERVSPSGRTVAIKLTVLGRLVALKIKESK